MDSNRLARQAGRTVENLTEELPPIEGAYLVLAGPGTGKTTLLAERASQIISGSAARKVKLLGLTFTNKAAGEMKARLGSRITNLEDRTFIGTFHSFANHVLRAHGSTIGIPADFAIYSEDDQREVLRQLQEEGHVPEGLNLDSVVHAFSRLKSRGLLGDLKQEETPDISGSLRELHETYRKRMRASNALDFGDLILEVARLFRERPQILRLYRTAYRYVLVDEFQDTTPAQYELLRLIVDNESPNLFAVADEDQLIFEWNEARLETLNQLCGDFKAKVIYSTLSHRCPPNIVEAANAVITNNRFRFPGKPEIRSRGAVVEPIRVYGAPTEEAEAAFIASTVQELPGAGYRPGDMAVIARARRLLDPTEAALGSVHIPAARPTLAGLGGTEEAEAILRLLRWLQNSRDEQSARHVVRFFRPQVAGAFEAALRTGRERGVGSEAALAGELNGEEGNLLRELVERVAHWRLLTQDTHRLLRELQDGLPNLLPAADEDSSAEEVRRVIDHLEELRQGMSARGRLSLPDFILGLPQMVGGGHSSRVSVREGVVSLLTYHQAKGLEFAVVFLIALESGIFPDFRSEKDSRRIEEERRLFYVGITRTKSRLYLTYSRQRSTARGGVWARDPSPFLSEIPPHLIEYLDHDRETDR